MTTALATTGKQAILTVQEMMSIGEMFYQSGLFMDIRGAAQATTKIIAGQELGIPPFAAMNGFHIVKGKAAMGANLIGATIKRSGKYDYIVREMTPERCAIEFFQVIGGKRESIGISEFDLADAKKAGTQNLDKFPRNMLFARAMSNGARWYTPDVFLGPIYTPEELGELVDEAGDVIVRPGAASYTPPAPVAVAAEPVTTTTQATPADDGILQLATAVKKLRDAESAIGLVVPSFTRKQAQDLAALEAEHSRSRDRLYDWLSDKADAPPALGELPDAALIDAAYTAAGL